MLKKNYKWWLLVFLFVTFFLEQGTRQIYNAVLPQVKIDFLKYGVSDAQLGMVGTIFGTVFGFSLVGSGLAFLDDLRLKLTVAVTRDGYLALAVVADYGFLAVTVSAVSGVVTEN